MLNITIKSLASIIYFKIKLIIEYTLRNIHFIIDKSLKKYFYSQYH